MIKYVALMRGIGPSNPNMHGSKLKAVIEELGYTNVETVISSGNVIFESSESDISELEAKIESAWPIKLGFNSLTIIRSQDQLQSLVERNPFKGLVHSRENYLLVTFFKRKPDMKDLTDTNFIADKAVNALCSTLNTREAGTPDFMLQLEKRYGKEITSRTFKTIERILAKM